MASRMQRSQRRGRITPVITVLVIMGGYCMTLAGDLGDYASHAQSGRSVVITGTHGSRLRITPYTDHMVRVQAVRSGEEFYADDRYEIVERHDHGGSIAVSEESDRLVLTIGSPDGLRVEVTKSDMRCTFVDRASNETLLTEKTGVSWKNQNETGSFPTEVIQLDFVPEIESHKVGFGHGDYLSTEHLDLNGSYSEARSGHGSFFSPFLMSTRGYGLVLNTPLRHKPLFQKWGDGKNAIFVDNRYDKARVDYFVLQGPGFPSILRRLALLTGKPCLPPKAVFGLHMSDKSGGISSAADWQAKVNAHRSAGLPLDCIIFDNNWRVVPEQFGSTYEWSTERWPDPAAFASWAQDSGMLVSVDFNMNNSENCDGWKEEYEIPSGYQYAIPDYSSPAVKTWIWDLLWTKVHNPALGYPNDLIWFDENDRPLTTNDTPLDWIAGNGLMWIENQKRYNLHIADAIIENGWEKDFGDSKRHFLWMRGSTLGAQRNSSYWTGDIYNTYDAMKTAVVKMGISSLSCFPWYNHDAGGHRTDITEDMYIQWTVAMGSMTPIWRPHGPGPSRWPLDRSAAAQQAMLTYGKLRYTLTPFFYSYACNAAHTGDPIARPMPYRYQDHDEAWTHEYQYMLGDELLIAPNFSDGDKSYDVWFPPDGDWYDWWTDTKVTGGAVRTVNAKKGVLPIYAKAGAIIPRRPYRQSIAWLPLDTLELDVFAGADGSFTLHEDDGMTQKWRNGEQRTTAIEYRDATCGVRIAAAQGTFDGAVASRVYVIRYHGLSESDAQTTLEYNENELARHGSRGALMNAGSGVWWDGDARVLTVLTPSMAVGQLVKVGTKGTTELVGNLIGSAAHHPISLRLGTQRYSLGVRTPMEGTATLFDMTGRTVRQWDLGTGATELRSSAPTPGSYLVRFHKAGKTVPVLVR